MWFPVPCRLWSFVSCTLTDQEQRLSPNPCRSGMINCEFDLLGLILDDEAEAGHRVHNDVVLTGTQIESVEAKITKHKPFLWV